MKIYTVLALAMLSVATPVAAAEQMSTLAQIEKTGKIRIGFRESEPPMSFRDENGNPAGYSIDLCDRIVTGVKTTLRKSDVVVEYVPVDSANRFTALSDNEIDILCGSTTKTLSRGELVDFTQLTFVTGASLLSLALNPIDNISGLRGKKVAVVKDTTTIAALKDVLDDTLTDAKVVAVDSASQGLKALQEGRVDAFSSDQVVLIGLIMTSDEPEVFSIANELFSFEPFALAVRRNDADFRLVADRVLSHLYRSKLIGRIYGQWFGRFSRQVPTALQAVYMINATPE